MDMWILLAVGLGGLWLCSLIMPWVNRAEIARLRNELERLKASLNTQERPIQKDLSLPADTNIVKPKAVQMENASKPVAAPKPVKAKRSFSFEQQFGARLPVWIGGIALALAGFYLVKYSIDSGLLTESVRCILGIAFGAGLLYGGNYIRMRPSIANGTRIAQSITGAGIAVMYLSIFAASSLYHLIPSIIGFAGMAAVTATAVILSLKQGMPIALLGMLGGFLTPVLIRSGNPDAMMLFGYLYLLLNGLMIALRRQGWWFLSLGAVAASYLWVLFWIFCVGTSHDAIWLALFVVASAASLVKFSYNQPSLAIHYRDRPLSNWFNYFVLGGAVLVMSLVLKKADFGLLQWGMFWLLAAGTMVLSYFNYKEYRFAPWGALVASALLLADFWDPWATPGLITTTIAFSVLFTVGSYILMWRTKQPLYWGALSSVAAVTYYLLAYKGLHWQVSFDYPFWGIVAFAFAFCGLATVQKLLANGMGKNLAGIYALLTTAFIAIGMCIELPREFFSVFIAAEMLAVAWVNTRVEIPALRKIVAGLAITFGILLLPQIIFLFELSIYSVSEHAVGLVRDLPSVKWPVFQLGIPALFFAGSTLLLRKQKDDRLVRLLEMAAVALLGTMGYYLTRHIFNVPEDILFRKPAFIERGVITNVFYLYGLACFVIGKRYGRIALAQCALVIICMAALRNGWFDLLLHNPLWSNQNVGATPVFNGLLITYALPVIWLGYAIRYSGKVWAKTLGNILRLLLGFAFVTFLVRHFYHGEYLSYGGTGNAETYTYSVVWLLFGIGLLIRGTMQHNRLTRVASLLVMLLVVGKVFLYDVSELTGLFRVFSFLGLGISLIGLSWFYTRFVFGKGHAENHPAD